jgi:eukaryotic-like serine/threonine-protein kinase
MDVKSIVREIITRYTSPAFQSQDGAFARFKARDRRAGVDVLIHVLPRIVEQSPRLQKEFAQLGRAIQLLDHPHVIRVMEVAQEKGVPYLIHSAIDDARRLSAQLTSEPIDLDRAARIITQVGNALDYAGHKQVPHGALTPDQVVVNEHGEASVVGLGLASLAALFGTRPPDENNAYLAPEQRLPDHAPTMRGDVYSLAAILYRMVTGVEPDLNADPANSLRADQLNEKVPSVVGHVIAQAMDADPLQRPRSPDDMVRGLLAAIRAPAVVRQQIAAAQKKEAEAAGAPSWPDPLPFPDQVDIPLTDMAIWDDISRQTRSMLEEASGLIQTPTYVESLELTDDDDLPNFDAAEWR